MPLLGTIDQCASRDRVGAYYYCVEQRSAYVRCNRLRHVASRQKHTRSRRTQKQLPPAFQQNIHALQHTEEERAPLAIHRYVGATPSWVLLRAFFVVLTRSSCVIAHIFSSRPFVAPS